jgi:hypothetical protein
LRDRGFEFEPQGDQLRVPLPSDFGVIQFVELKDGETILGLVNHEWHTHGELLIPDYGADIPSAVVAFLEDILFGRLKMIEFQLPGQKPKRIIEDDIETFLKYKQPGEMVRIFESKKTTEPGA